MANNFNAQTFGNYGAAWEHLGYCGCGNVADLLDSLRGRSAIVCGNARGVFEEFEQVSRETDSVVFAANDCGMYLKHVDHFVSLHPSKLKHWVDIRRDVYSREVGNPDFKVHSYGPDAKQCADYDWQGLTPLMALSGNFAMQIAYLMGCSPIILCGCPGDATPRFWELTCENPGYVICQDQIRKETAFKPDLKKAVRSMSGWSKEFFGGL